MESDKTKLKQLKRRLKKNPNDYAAHMQLGVLCLEQEKIASAAQYLEKACQIRKDQPDLHLLLANTYKLMGDFALCERYFQSAIELGPANFNPVYHYAVFLQENQRLGEAGALFRKAAVLAPGNAELLNNIGIMFLRMDDDREAIDFLRRAVEVNGDYFVAQVNLAQTYLKVGDHPNAGKIIERLEMIHPQENETRELRVRLNVAVSRGNSETGCHDVDLTFSQQSFQIAPIKIIKNFSENGAWQEVGLSVVVPVKDEEENIPILYRELAAVLNNLKQDYEIIFINDGSSDGTGRALEELAEKDAKVKIIQFRRNYGQTAALNAGFKFSRGDVVVTLDGDLQNDPRDIPRLLEKMAEGFDLVSGWRRDRKDRLITRKAPSAVANLIINWLIFGTGVQLHDFGCTLKAYKRGIIKNITLYGEMHRFIPVFAAWLGVKVTEIPVHHRPRIHGQPKYNLSRVSRVIFDLIVVRFFSDYMTRPIQFFGRIARMLAFYGLAGLLFCAVLSAYGVLPLSLNTLVLLTAILLFAILQFVSIGLLGEIMIRSYFEGQKKDYYVVEKIINQENLS